MTELREVLNVASVACQLSLYGAVEKVRAFDWINFRKKRILWQEVVDAEDLDELISWAEEIVYAPMRDFEREAIREALANHAAIGSDQATTNAKEREEEERHQKRTFSKMSLSGERLSTTTDGDAGGAHGPHSGISLPLMPLHIRKDEPLIQIMHDIIMDQVESNRTPRSDIIDRAAGAADGCTQQ